MGTNKFRHGIYVTGSIKEVPFTPDPDSVSANPEIHYYIKATSEGKTYYYCADGTWIREGRRSESVRARVKKTIHAR